MTSSKISVSILLTAFITLSACSSKNNNEETTTTKPIEVVTQTANVSTESSLNMSGKIVSAKMVQVSTRIMGRVNAVYVNVGDVVKAGQLLASINDDDIQAKKSQTQAMISEAQAAYLSAKKDYERFQQLYKLQSATAKELDNVTLQYNAAKARVDAAKQMKQEVSVSLGYSKVTAPFSGVITQKLIEQGAIANPGMPLFTIEQNDELEVHTTVAENEIALIKQGQKVEINIQSIQKNILGSIKKINPSALLSAGRYEIKIAIPAVDQKLLFPGMIADINLLIPSSKKESTQNLFIPKEAIVYQDQLTGIYTVTNNNIALLRWVRLGKTVNNTVEVLSGLSNNETFVLSSSDKLYNGVKVVTKK